MARRVDHLILLISSSEPIVEQPDAEPDQDDCTDQPKSVGVRHQYRDEECSRGGGDCGVYQIRRRGACSSAEGS